MTKPAIHPSTYSAPLLPVLKELLATYAPDSSTVLDPFAGLGQKFGELCESLKMVAFGVEIEQGYFDAGATHPCVQQGDSTDLPFTDGFFDAAVTSPVYPNGMADDFVAKDDSIRHTYIHRLRAHLGNDYQLSLTNAAATNPRRSPKALAQFYNINRQVWEEVYRVLKPGAPFIVNTKDPLNVPFLQQTWEQLVSVGFLIVDHCEVNVGGLNHGKHQGRKNKTEDIIVAIKPIFPGGASIPFPTRAAAPTEPEEVSEKVDT